MKIRSDFVTNSSSSSFIIAKKHLDDDQIVAIHIHRELAIKLGMLSEDAYYAYPWSIQENDDYIAGDVSMDNFSMHDFLERIGVPMHMVSWDEYPFDIDMPDIDDKKKCDYDTPNKDWRKILHEDTNGFCF